MTDVNGNDAKSTAALFSAGLEAAEEHDSIGPMVRRMVGQCGALIAQHLERRTRQDPLTYSEARVDQAMRSFENARSDIEGAIIARVKARTLAFVQQEIVRVLDDAVKEGTEYIQDPISGRRPERLWSSLREEPLAPVLPLGERGGSGLDARAPKREISKDPESLDGNAPRRRAPATAQKSVAVAQPAQQDLPKTVLAVAVPVPSASQASGAQAPSVSLVYEGTVRLYVEAAGGARQVLPFVDALRRRPEFRLLQLVGDYKDGVGIWLGLRAPLSLPEVLRGMEGVSQVMPLGPSEGEEPLITVQLAGAHALN